MRIALAQTKQITGDLEGNLEQIVKSIKQAHDEKADIVVFPETAVTAYPCGARFEDLDFVCYNKALVEEVIAKYAPEDMVAVVGFVDVKGVRRNGKPDIYNSMAVLQGGKVVDTYDKQLLANDDHHEDAHYFTPGAESKVIPVNIKGQTVRIGPTICEDNWNMDHDRDIVAETKAKGADIIISSHQSYFYHGKQAKRHKLFGSHAKEKSIPVIAVNAAGVGDIVKNIMIYDGGSMAYDSHGNLVTECDRFKPDFKVIDLDLAAPTAAPAMPKQWEKFEEIYDALKFEQRELFDTLGIPKAQVHLSGGLDSSIVAAIAADAMGPERCVFISNPTTCNGKVTKGNAQQTADLLGVELKWNPTQEPYEAVVKAHKESFGQNPQGAGAATAQAVMRTVQGLMASHQYRTGIVATGNHTENVLGWFSFHDIGSIGVHQILGDMPKMDEFAFARYINKRLGKEVIPSNLYDGKTKPAAELPDANEDPIDYFMMSGICAEMIRNRKSINGLVEAYRERTLTPDFFPKDDAGRSVYDLYTEEQFTGHVIDAFGKAQRSVFKCAQSAPPVIISPRARGFSDRETIIDRYKGWCSIKEVKQLLDEKYGPESSNTQSHMIREVAA
jgi:predicted amidohydrolase